MALPTSRTEFISYIKKELGEPVICVNVDAEQIEDRVDYALSYYGDYHFDATEKVYFKHKITANDFPEVVRSLAINDGGTGYANGDALVFTAGSGEGAAATVLTNGTGVITSFNFANNGFAYAVAPVITVTSGGGGTGADIDATLGGFIELPENIIGVVGIFDLTNAITNISNMFSIQYQIALNEIWSLSSYSMVPYYTTIQHLNLIQQLLVGQQPVRYTRHRNRLHIDMAWQRVIPGQYLVVDAHEVIDPDVFTDVWKDRWLLHYGTQLVKKNWGTNLKKFEGMPLPGNITFNGQKIYDEAVREIAKLEEEMVKTYSLPTTILTG